MMSDLKNITILIFSILTFLSASYQFYNGVKFKKPLSIVISISFLIPIFTLLISSLLSYRLGHWTQYIFIYPISLINLIKTSIDLKITKPYRLSILLSITLTGLFNYDKVFVNDIESTLLTEKAQSLARKKGVLNIFLTLENPFYKELALYYGGIHKSTSIMTLDRFGDKNQFADLIDLHTKYDFINFLFIENDPIENEFSKKVLDIILKNYRIKDISYDPFVIHDHFYQNYEKKILKKMLLQKKP